MKAAQPRVVERILGSGILGQPHLLERVAHADSTVTKVTTHTSGALFSTSKSHRLALWRVWGDPAGSRLGWIMLNPSTADETNPDRTVTRCVGYARRDGFHGIEITNLFTLRTPYPKDLHAAIADDDGDLFSATVVHEGAALEIVRMVKRCEVVVLAWGSSGRQAARERWAEIAPMIEPFESKLRVLKVNDDGDPAHPLMQRGDLRLTWWEGLHDTFFE